MGLKEALRAVWEGPKGNVIELEAGTGVQRTRNGPINVGHNKNLSRGGMWGLYAVCKFTAQPARCQAGLDAYEQAQAEFRDEAGKCSLWGVAIEPSTQLPRDIVRYLDADGLELGRLVNIKEA